MEVIMSNKGGQKLVLNGNMYTVVICTQWPYVHNGHMYTKQIMTKTSIRWRYVERTAFCKGILATDLNSNNGRVIVDHNHAAGRRCCNKMCNAHEEESCNNRRQTWSNICH